MMLPIRRPVRPQPGPLHERNDAGTDKRPDWVWLSVRHKRTRHSVTSRTKLLVRGAVAAATTKF